MLKYNLIFLFIFISIEVFFAQSTNGLCANPQPFCTGQTIQFPAGVNTGVGQTGPDYGCLFTQPNPAWFYFQMATTGPVSISMFAPQDIDFICWGPFPSATGNCGNLTAANTEDCSYSSSNTETCTIANAIAGQFYLLLITNYSNSNQQITFNQLNANSPGAGVTNCGVLCSMTVTATNSLCSGQTATLSALTTTAIQSILWSGPNGFTSTSNNISIPNIQSSGNYTCVATTTGTNPATNTCSITKSITVVQTPTPIVINNGPICAGSTAGFTVSGATSYTWGGPNGFISTVNSPVISNAQLINSGLYSLVASNAGCTATASSSLVVNPNPNVIASNSGSYCVGQSFNLLANGASSYTWAGPSSFTSNLSSPNFININTNLNGTYSVVGSSNGCTNIATTTVVVNPLPIITASTSGNVCEDFSVTLSAGGGTSYAWSGPAGFINFMQNAQIQSAIVANSGTYSVKGVDANGCLNTATVGLTIYPKPVITVTGAKSCIGDPLNLQVTGGANYSWVGPNGFSSTSQNPVINNADFNSVGAYNVTVTSVGGCTTSGTTFCDVYSKPIVNFTGNTEVCKGGDFSFLGNGAVNYKWLATFGIVTTNTLLTVSSISNSLQTTYTLVGADGNGCTNSVVVIPTVLALPFGVITSDKIGDCAPFKTTFYLQKGSTLITDVNWNFSNGAKYIDSTQVTQYFQTPGIHSVNVSLIDSKGCKGTTSLTVEGYSIPVAEFQFTPEKPTENDNVVNFIDETKNATIVDWFWDFFSNGIDTSYKNDPSYTFPEIGNYFVSLKVKSDHGCMDSIVKKLTVTDDVTFYIPNSFTPNGDGNNEVFMPKAVGVKKFKMEIFDRWGQLVHSSTDIYQGWDGKSKKGGDVLAQDIYVYKIIATDINSSKPKQFTGHVTLLK